MKLQISKIRLDGDTQPRVSMNEEVIAEYTEKVMNGKVFPPVTVFHDGTNYWLADGFHRVLSHKRAAALEVEADVREGTLRDALLFSVGANDENGLRRTNEDKRRAVMILLLDPEWSEWSDSEIARRANVSNATVHRIKKSLQLEAKPDRKYKDKHGNETVMSTQNLGKKETPEIPAQPDPVQEMAAELTAIAEENTKLKEMLAVEAMDVPEELKLDVTTQLEQYKHRIRVLETEVEAIRRSRDVLQNENAELLKQVHYWRKRCQKLDQKVA